MSESDTPRTDVGVFTVKDTRMEIMRDNRQLVDAFLCRQLERELTAVTEQRDRLAVALQELRNNESMSLGGAAYEIVEQALQSLTTNEL